MTRAVIDTNHLIRIAAGGNRSDLFQAWQAGRFEVVMSLATMTELRQVLARPRIQRLVSLAAGSAFCDLLERKATWVQPDLSAPQCRDPQDSSLIASAVGGQADYLVSADPDLLDDSALMAALSARGVRLMPAFEFRRVIATG